MVIATEWTHERVENSWINSVRLEVNWWRIGKVPDVLL